MPIKKVEEICVFNSKIYYPQITDGHVPTNSAKGFSDGNVYYGTNKRSESGGKTTRYPTNILEFKCVDNYHRLHPNEKPVELLEYLIKTYTNENDLILDNCMGSGSTGEACANTNRDFIGIELDENYFNVAKERIESVNKN
jgi:site-specific DNA-methyltransferase (adenine-specific)